MNHSLEKSWPILLHLNHAPSSALIEAPSTSDRFSTCLTWLLFFLFLRCCLRSFQAESQRLLPITVGTNRRTQASA
jgi:hypothetical protein